MNWHADDGTAGPIEMLSVVMFALATLVFLGYLGRMNTTATRITSSARTSARAASLAATPEDARSAAEDAIARSGMNGLCARPPIVDSCGHRRPSAAGMADQPPCTSRAWSRTRRFPAFLYPASERSPCRTRSPLTHSRRHHDRVA